MTAALDRSLPVNCWEDETNLVHGCRFSSLVNDELIAAQRSLREKCLQGINCKCYTPTEKWLLDGNNGARNDDSWSPNKVVLDFMALHRERALNAGKLNKDRGRRWRRKHFYFSKKSGEWETLLTALTILVCETTMIRWNDFLIDVIRLNQHYFIPNWGLNSLDFGRHCPN